MTETPGYTIDRAAAELRRPRTSIKGALEYHRLRFHDDAQADTIRADRQAQVKALHATGLSPCAIADQIGACRETVAHDHAALGLKPHTIPRADRTRRGRVVTLSRYGQCPVSIRHETGRIEALKDGWPPVSKCERDYLETFYERGPLSCRELAAIHHRNTKYTTQVVYRLRCAGALEPAGELEGHRRLRFDLTRSVRLERHAVLALRSEGVA